MENQNDNFSKLFGAEISKASNKLDDMLLAIQNKYNDFFTNEFLGVFENGKQKTILDYRVIYYTPPQVGFGFSPEIDIPDYIMSECQDAFKKCFT